MTPRLSIVIPSHCRADLLALCLQTVTRYAPPGTEILVVDDGSPDAIISRTAELFPGVRVLRHETALGFCRAANAGIEATSGEFVELLNDDTQVFPGWAEAALARFADVEVGAVAPLVLRGPFGEADPCVDSAGDEYHRGGYARKRWNGRKLSTLTCGGDDVGAASGSSAFYRRSALAKAGLFSEEFGAYFEDVDLSCRIRAAGYRIRYEPTCRVWHAVGSSYGRMNRRLLMQQSRNEEWLFWRNLRPDRRLPDLLRHVGVLGAKGLMRMHEGQLFAWLRGRMRAWARLRG